MANREIIVSAVIGALTIGVGIWQFSEDSIRRTATEQFEAKKPYLVKQMDLCFTATEAASTLASSVDPDKWGKAKETFWVLYWGPLAVVERPLTGVGGGVESAMKRYVDALKPLQGKPNLPL